MHIKFHISVLLTITIFYYSHFLLWPLSSLKTGCFSLFFFSLSNDACYMYVMINTFINKIHFNKRIISYHRLKLSLKSLPRWCLHNFKIHTYIITNSRANDVLYIRSYLEHYSFQNITPVNYNNLWYI